MSAVVTASVGLFFAAKLPTPIFEIFRHPRAIRMGPIGGKHRSVHVGVPRDAFCVHHTGWGETGPPCILI